MPIVETLERKEWMGEIVYDIIEHFVERKVKFRDVDKIFSLVKSIIHTEMFDGLVTLDLLEDDQN